MRKLLIIVLIALAAVSVFAADPLCKDFDNGGARSSDDALKTKEKVEYGITDAVDTCLTAEEGVSTNSGRWLKEYYCGDDQRRYEVYDCIKLGYEGCENGACKGKAGSNGTTSTSTPKPVVSCGNKIVEKDKGENCDPPGSICFGKSTAEYGTCQNNCQCKIAAAAKQAAKCGDDYLDEGEDCEKDADCTSGEVCSSCNCVKKLTPEEIAQLTSKDERPKEEVKKEEKEAPVIEKEEAPQVDLEGKNFSEDPGIQATSGIANFFRKVFGWLAGLFS